jgi:hypothetical protein
VSRIEDFAHMALHQSRLGYADTQALARVPAFARRHAVTAPSGWRAPGPLRLLLARARAATAGSRRPQPAGATPGYFR